MDGSRGVGVAQKVRDMSGRIAETDQYTVRLATGADELCWWGEMTLVGSNLRVVGSKVVRCFSPHR